jgi:hypothetical protein
MKHATTILKELALHVQPPPGCTIELTEAKPNGPGNLNWTAGCGNMNDEKSASYTNKVIELRKTDPQIDWSGVSSDVGQRRIVYWTSGPSSS